MINTGNVTLWRRENPQGIVKIDFQHSFPQTSGVMLLVVSWMDGTYYRLDWQVAFTQALSKMKFQHS
jgi:hypothetical protein